MLDYSNSVRTLIPHEKAYIVKVPESSWVRFNGTKFDLMEHAEGAYNYMKQTNTTKATADNGHMSVEFELKTINGVDEVWVGAPSIIHTITLPERR